MKDYKEIAQLKLVPLKYEDIVSELREETAYPPYADMLMKRAAEAVEQLVKERDAAIADLRGVVAATEMPYCKLCKYREEDGQCHHLCIPYSDKWGWEWRGVREEEHETD